MSFPDHFLIPLFPLNAVLFPGSLLPLHIFEERYKVLINQCVAENKQFGINLIYENKIRSIGCLAFVRDVLQRHSDGTMEIIVEGVRRYTLHSLAESDQPYQVGSVSYYDDTDEPLDRMLLDKATTLYNQFVTAAFKGTVQSIVSFEEEAQLSFVMVQKSGLELIQRQLFLTLKSENKRLEYLISHFESMLPMVLTKNQVEAIIINDGYISLS
ncbi:MAG: LON peptidase substrate-binding domain-containing protein [Acidobacteriota bacterium]